jgi:hypothetical protein
VFDLGSQPNRAVAEAIFDDYTQRRLGMLKALTEGAKSQPVPGDRTCNQLCN